MIRIYLDNIRSIVNRVQNYESEELQWFKDQIERCRNDEEVEESIESLHRIDAL